MAYIPYGRQEITAEDIRQVVEVLESDFLTQGPQVPKFESLLQLYCQVKHAVAVNSATSALHIACLALGLQPGDTLWTTPITFVASANCALYCGAKVDFVDIDPKTYNLCPNALSSKLEWAAANNCLPKVVVPVHLCGQPCDMKRIRQLADQYGFKIIEDASHAVGGRYLGQPIGNCEFSDITVFSFHPVKIITTAEGGVALTNNSVLASRMALLRSHGITREAEKMTHSPDGDWYYQQIGLGFNYRLTELQAALGVSQMDRLDAYVTRRHEIFKAYQSDLQDLPVTTPWQHPDGYSGLHLYVLRINEARCGVHRSTVFDAMRAQEIGVNVHYIPVHLQPYYEKMGFKKGDFPEAEKYYEEAISIPMYPGLNERARKKVVDILRQFIKAS